MNDTGDKLLEYRLETAQDKEAFVALYERYKGPLRRFIAFRVSSREIAEDIRDDVFLKLWAWVTERRKITNFRALAYRIARNAVIDHYREQSVHRTMSLDEVGLLEPLTEDLAALIGSSMDHANDRERLAQTLKVLSADDIELLMLFYSEDLRVKEIAKIVNMRAGTVRVRIHRALKRLQTQL